MNRFESYLLKALSYIGDVRHGNGVASLRADDYLFPGRLRESPHLDTRQYARIVDGWVKEIGLDPAG